MTIAADEYKLGRLQRHGKDSLDRMARRIANLVEMIAKWDREEHKLAWQWRRQQRLRFERQLGIEMGQIVRRIENKRNPPVVRRSPGKHAKRRHYGAKR
jgi:hypothetical protein